MICERDIYNLTALQKIPCPIKLMAPSYHLVTESPPVHESKIKHHALVEDMDENGVPHRNNDSSRPWRYGHHRQPQKEGQSSTCRCTNCLPSTSKSMLSLEIYIIESGDDP
ncbi:hypothetical protein NC651_022811 [Populus alba x Populus x berolinensis]|nr:hypothetical protein NC651_022811 [Populus alba x Populus x berolinensis]